MSPSSPDQWPHGRAVRRLLVAAGSPACPVRGVELQASYAHVHSPEHRPGAGTDQDKWSLSGRWERPDRRHTRSTDWSSGPGPRRPTGSSFSTASWPKVHGRPAVTVSITGSSEPSGRRRSGIAQFRSLRPHLENSILGIDPLDHPYRWLVRRRARSDGRVTASRRSSSSPTGGWPRSGADSSTWSRPMAGATSGLEPRAPARVRRRPMPSDGPLRCGARGSRCHTHIEASMDCAQDVVDGIVAVLAMAASCDGGADLPDPTDASGRSPEPPDHRNPHAASTTRRRSRPERHRRRPQRRRSASPRISGSTASYAYTGTWGGFGGRATRGTRSRSGRSTPRGAPALADSLIVPGVGTVSDVEVSADGRC